MNFIQRLTRFSSKVKIWVKQYDDQLLPSSSCCNTKPGGCLAGEGESPGLLGHAYLVLRGGRSFSTSEGRRGGVNR